MEDPVEDGDCDYDELSFYAGTTDLDPVLGRRCGTEFDPIVVDDARAILAVFRTDYDINGRGFSLCLNG